MVNPCFVISLTLLTNAKVTVTQILQSTGVETWVTSDGRAYFVRLQESRPSEDGTSEFSEEDTSIVGLPVLLFPANLTHSVPRVQLGPKPTEHPDYQVKVLAHGHSIIGKVLVSITSRYRGGYKSSAASMMAVGGHQLTLNFVGP